MSVLPEVSLDEFNAKAQAFLDVHRSTDSQSFIANVRTRVESIAAGPALLPVTVNDGELDNAWICSPYTTYCAYASEEAARMGRAALAAPLNGLIRCVGALLRRAEVDRAVAVNNWLVSTNCYPRLREANVNQAIGEAKARWPGHAIWFRSLNTIHHSDWLRALDRLGGILLPSRQVYLFDRLDVLARGRADLKRDLALLRTNDRVTHGPIADHEIDFRRAEELYAELYVRKYSRLNPQYRYTLLRAWSRAGLLKLHGLRDAEGMLQGVVGLFTFGNLITSPIVGYNTGLPQEWGLYRRLAACVLGEGATQSRMVNLSAGVAHFKRQRGGEPALEYSVVFVDHLPPRRRRAIRVLAFLARNIGVPIMRRFKL